MNGSAQEPAEFGKLLVVYFLPWLVFPLDGVRRPVATIAAIVLSLATLSIIGILLVALALVMILTSRQMAGGLRLSALALAYLVLLAAVIVGDSVLQGFFVRLTALEEDASTIIRTTYNLAALQLVAENPWLGVGWSNELFLFPEKIAHIAHLWEVQNDIRLGNALTAKSLALRLMMYLGLPLFAYFAYATARVFLFPPHEANHWEPTVHDRARARFVIMLFTLAAMIDGGILTSFFGWACLIFPLAMLAPCPASAAAGRMSSDPQFLRGTA
nr:O-antigen ligase family protein [Thalassobius sp. Cn5-15]